MTQFIDTLVGIFQSSGFAQFGQPGGWLYAVMICVYIGADACNRPRGVEDAAPLQPNPILYIN